MKEDKKKNNHEEMKENEEIKSGTKEAPELEPVNELTLKIETLEKNIDDCRDRLLRKAAEFENYKKRTDNERVELFKYASEDFIKKLLPVVDDFERSIAHFDSAKDVESIKEGINIIYSSFVKLLDDQGVKPIEAIGKPFDYNYHDAIMKQPAKGVEPETVINEIKKGYMYKDKVIRHSQVIISEEAKDSSEDNTNQEQVKE